MIVEQNGVTLKVKGNKITVTVKGREFYAIYPYDMTDVAEDLLRAMLYVLFIGLIDMPKPRQTSDRKGEKVLLSFSGGVDSYAVHEMIDCIPVYLNRDYQPDYGKQQQGIVKAVGSIVINNNMELIRKLFNKPHGFNWGSGYSALLLPLMDKLSAKYIALGVVFDDACYKPDNGKITYIQSKPGKYHMGVSGVGVDIIWPAIGVSEAITTTVSRSGEFSEMVSSCHNTDLRDCGRCVKCLRKADRVVMDAQMMKVVEAFKARPKMSPTMVYSLKKYFSVYKKIDTSLIWNIHEHILRNWNPDNVVDQVLKLGYNVVNDDKGCIEFQDQYNTL